MNRRLNLNDTDQYNYNSNPSSKSIDNGTFRSSTGSSNTFLRNPQKLTAFGELATPQSRLMALILDALIFGLGFGVIWIIWFVTLADKGTTPGHHLMGQVVIDAETGTPLGWKRMAVREILIKGLLHWVLGSFLFMANYIVDGAFVLTSKQRTLHDMMVGSQVLQHSDKTILRKLNSDEVDEWLSR